MLDTFVFKGEGFELGGGFLSYRPYIKPTARHVPLSHHSLHSWSVHRSWPVSEIRRMHSLSMTSCQLEVFKVLKISRF